MTIGICSLYKLFLLTKEIEDVSFELIIEDVINKANNCDWGFNQKYINIIDYLAFIQQYALSFYWY